MTAPPRTPFTVEDVPEDFGPDFKATPRINVDDLPPVNPPKGTPKPRAAKGFADKFQNLGKNKKARPGLRKLTDNDRDRIAQMYMFAAMPLMPFKPMAAQTLVASSDVCAAAWIELAEENDNVRRALLGMLEGGVWAKVFAAHLPILLALIPERVWPPVMRESGMIENLINTVLSNLDTNKSTPDAE